MDSSEDSGRQYKLERFLSDVEKQSKKRAKTEEKKRKSKPKEKRIDWSLLTRPRGLFENTVLGRSMIKDLQASPNNEARLNGNIVGLAREGSDSEDILMESAQQPVVEENLLAPVPQFSDFPRSLSPRKTASSSSLNESSFESIERRHLSPRPGGSRGSQLAGGGTSPQAPRFSSADIFSSPRDGGPSPELGALAPPYSPWSRSPSPREHLHRFSPRPRRYPSMHEEVSPHNYYTPSSTTSNRFPNILVFPPIDNYRLSPRKY